MKLIKLFSIVIVGLVIGNVTLANQGLDASFHMSQISSEVESLSKEISLLEASLSEEGSLAVIIPRIEEAGFVPAARVIAIGSEKSEVALR